VAETVPEERRSSNEPEPPDRGCAVVLWLFRGADCGGRGTLVAFRAHVRAV